eukprot:TRINITY_DN1345_c0_g2_i1.p1 TRINITY_DN1345_c0_g2~~TRINITY_DN1345_c0_g2_i1.p1  ORF type:complete len:124 (-),score=15.48 TRINITY_DN1345_c0_g2_i1:29-400(-)
MYTITILLLCFVASSLCFDFSGTWYRGSDMNQLKVSSKGTFIEGVFSSGPRAGYTSFNATLVGDKTFGFGNAQLYNSRTNMPTDLVQSMILGDDVSKNVFRIFYGTAANYNGDFEILTRSLGN